MSDTSESLSQTDNADLGGGDGGGAEEATLASLLSESFDEISSREDEAGDAPAEPSSGESPAPEPIDGAPDSEADATADKTEGESEDTEESIADAEVEPPSDFTAEEKEAFSKLTPEAKALLASYSNRSHQSRTKVATELDQIKKAYEPLADTLKRYDPLFNATGQRSQEVVGNLLQYYHALVAGDAGVKRNVLERIANDFQIDLTRPDNTEQEFIDPEIKSLKEQNAEIMRELNSFKQNTAETSMSRAQEQVDAFRDAKDEKGNPRHPHFGKLEQSMISLISGGLAKSLDEAYAKAKMLDPEITEAETKAKAEARRLADAKAASDAKRAAEANRKGANAPARKNGPPPSDKELVTETYDELHG